MNTILTICGDAACCMNKTFCICQTCTKEVGTSWEDIVIVCIISVAFAIVAITGFCKYFSWKNKIADKTPGPSTNQGNIQQQPETPKEKEERLYKQELQRKDRVNALFKDIYTFCKDENDKYNKVVAEELLHLYKQIDEYDRSIEKPQVNQDETQR